jgi:hypothetical protein
MCCDFFYLGGENGFCIFFCSTKSGLLVGESMGFERATINFSSKRFVRERILATRGAATVSGTKTSGHRKCNGKPETLRKQKDITACLYMSDSIPFDKQKTTYP